MNHFNFGTVFLQEFYNTGLRLKLTAIFIGLLFSLPSLANSQNGADLQFYTYVDGLVGYAPITEEDFGARKNTGGAGTLIHVKNQGNRDAFDFQYSALTPPFDYDTEILKDYIPSSEAQHTGQCSSHLAPGQMCFVVVRYSASLVSYEPGHYQTILSIGFKGGSKLKSVELPVSVEILPPKAELSILPEEIPTHWAEFQSEAGTTTVGTMVVTNHGQVAATQINIYMTNLAGQGFKILDSTCQSELAVRDSCLVTVEYTSLPDANIYANENYWDRAQIFVDYDNGLADGASSTYYNVNGLGY